MVVAGIVVVGICRGFVGAVSTAIGVGNDDVVGQRMFVAVVAIFGGGDRHAMASLVCRDQLCIGSFADFVSRTALEVLPTIQLAANGKPFRWFGAAGSLGVVALVCCASLEPDARGIFDKDVGEAGLVGKYSGLSGAAFDFELDAGRTRHSRKFSKLHLGMRAVAEFGSDAWMFVAPRKSLGGDCSSKHHHFCIVCIGLVGGTDSVAVEQGEC